MAKASSFSVFISYVEADLDFAERLVGRLRNKGHRVWWTHDAPESRFSLTTRIQGAMKRSDFFVALVSPSFVESQWGMFELGAALGRQWENEKPKLLPVAIKGLSPGKLHGPLATIKILDARPLSPEQTAQRLEAAMNSQSG